MRHIVPGNGGMMEVTCEDYDAFVAASLSSLRSELEEAREALRELLDASPNFIRDPDRYKAATTAARAALSPNPEGEPLAKRGDTDLPHGEEF
jgi:hypothetical protein